MSLGSPSTDRLRRLFSVGFTAADIAEPLASFDASTPVIEAFRLMQMRDFDVVGVRVEGLVTGYLDREGPAEGTCAERLRPLDEAALIADTAPLAEVILGLGRTPRLFVRSLGAVGGIVTRSDLQKPPVRMWLFGMITLVEMRMGRLVEQFCSGEDWKQFLSANRLQKAEALLEERCRRNQNLRLLDCLQFADKAQIIARNEAIRRLTRFTSRRQVEESCKALESLRNNLAHAQDIIATDWEMVLLLASDVDGVLFGTEQVQSILDAVGLVGAGLDPRRRDE